MIKAFKDVNFPNSIFKLFKSYTADVANRNNLNFVSNY